MDGRESWIGDLAGSVAVSLGIRSEYMKVVSELREKQRMAVEQDEMWRQVNRVDNRVYVCI